MHKNLRSFLKLLDSEKEVLYVNAEVDPYLELAEIHRRVIAEGGPALFFKRVKNSGYPVVTNLFGTARRLDLAFGPRPEQLVKRIAHVTESLLPPSAGRLWAERSLAIEALKLGTKRVRSGPVTEVIDQPAQLDQLPVLTTWQDDGGPFITLPLVYTEHPKTHKHNLGMYRIQRFDRETTGIHWQIHKGGGFHYHEAEKSGDELPVTIFLGGPPALILSAIAPLPEDIPELMLASLLAGQKIEVLERKDLHQYRLIAEAEFAVMGSVAAHERRPEGPFGDHYGYYSLQHDYPVFRAVAVAHRKDAIYPATVVGKPRQEDFFIGDYLQELLSPVFPLVMPSVTDLWSYGETGFHSLAAAVVKERYAREALVSAFRILGEGQLSLTKFLILTDKPQDLRNFKALLEYVLARVRWETDLFIFSNLSMDTLDYTSGKINRGSKAVLLGLGEAIRDLPRALPKSLPASSEGMEVFCGGCLVVQGRSFAEQPNFASEIAKQGELADWPLIVLHDDVTVARSTPDFLWATWTRFNPETDVYAAHAEVIKHHISYRGPVVIDARMKPGYPDELVVSEEVSRLVDRRWKEYFPK